MVLAGEELKFKLTYVFQPILSTHAELSQCKCKYSHVWEHLSAEGLEGTLIATEIYYLKCEYLHRFFGIMYTKGSFNYLKHDPQKPSKLHILLQV